MTTNWKLLYEELTQTTLDLRAALATEREARERAEKEASQYKLRFEKTAKSHEAANAHLKRAERERDTALARVEDLERVCYSDGRGMHAEDLLKLQAAETALASAWKLLESALYDRTLCAPLHLRHKP
jgi:hypothetical protein